MTRETKVGLLVGLGIILLIGIIVSDHLSVAQRQDAADLTHFAEQTQQSVVPAIRNEPSPQPAVTERAAPYRQRRIEASPPAVVRPARPLPEPAGSSPKRNQTRQRPENHLAASSQRTTVPTLSQTGTAEQTSPRSPVLSPVATTRAQPVIHYVKAGQSLWQIAQQYYGNGEYWRVIAQANPKAVAAKGNVRVGVRLVIPPKAALARRSSSTAQHATGADTRTVRGRSIESTRKTVQTDRSTSRRVYTVGADDSLSKIASRMLGDPNRWEDIYRANRKVLDDPDRLKVGQRLTIPPR